MFSPSKITRLNISNILSICIIQMSQSASSYVNLMDFSPQEKPIPWRSSGSPQFSVVLTLTSSGLSVTALAETPQCRKVRPCCLGGFFSKSWAPHIFRGKIWMMMFCIKYICKGLQTKPINASHHCRNFTFWNFGIPKKPSFATGQLWECWLFTALPSKNPIISPRCLAMSPQSVGPSAKTS